MAIGYKNQHLPMKLSTVFQSMFNQGMDTSLLQNLTSNTLPEMKAARL